MQQIAQKVIPIPPVDNEVALRARLKAGEPEALDDVLALYWGPVLAYATAILEDDDMGEEIAQITFVKLWLTRARLGSIGNLKALVFRIARNAALDERKRGGRDTHFVALQENDLRTQTTPADELHGTELEGRIENAIRAMPAGRREVFLLLRYAGLSHMEVAQQLELSPQTVANHMSLALKDLKLALKPHLHSI